MKSSFILCLVLALILGAFSIRPFTKLYLPWMMFAQWHRVAYPDSIDQTCFLKLNQQGAKFGNGYVPATDIARGCNIRTTVVVSHLGLKLTNIAYPPQADYVAMSCDLASRLNNFITETLSPRAINYFGVAPKVLLHKGAYSCRGQRSFTAIKSEHAFGDAIDFAGLILEDGRQFLIEDHYFENTEAGYFFKEIAGLACKHFGTNLGPEYDELHNDHLHWAIGFPKICL